MTVAVALFGDRLAFAIAQGFGFHQVGDFAIEADLLGDEVVGEEGGEGVVGPGVDGDEGDEVIFLGGEGKVNGPLFVQANVDLFEEVEPQPVAQGFAGGNVTPIFGPGGV
jgi:hypothetical protein